MFKKLKGNLLKTGICAIAGISYVFGGTLAVSAGEEIVAFSNDHACSFNAPYISCYEWTDEYGVHSTGTKYASDMTKEQKADLGEYSVKFIDSEGEVAVDGTFKYGARVYIYNHELPEGNNEAKLNAISQEIAVRQQSAVDLPSVTKIVGGKEFKKWTLVYDENLSAFVVSPYYELIPTPTPTATPEDTVKESNLKFLSENNMTTFVLIAADALLGFALLIRLLFYRE